MSNVEAAAARVIRFWMRGGELGSWLGIVRLLRLQAELESERRHMALKIRRLNAEGAATKPAHRRSYARHDLRRREDPANQRRAR